MSQEQESKKMPYLTGIITFPDGATAKVALWHWKPKKKQEPEEAGDKNDSGS